MAHINGLRLTSTNGSPTVHYDITYTKSRPSNSQMTYNFTIKASLASSGSFIGSGFALMCNITVNGVTNSVRIKANDNDNWSGTGARTKYVSVTCSSTTASANQAVRFKVYSDGRANLNAGVIDNSSHWVVSSALLYSSCGAPTSFSSSPNPFETNVTLSWSGAKPGTNNSISRMYIQYCTSSNGSSWGAWAGLVSLAHTATSGSHTRDISSLVSRGYYIKFRIRTEGSAGASYHSGYRESGSYRRNSGPGAPSSFSVSKSFYNQGDAITLSWSGASDINSNINRYVIQYRATSAGVFGTWYTLTTVYSSSAASSYSFVPSQALDQEKLQFRIKTVDSFSIESGYKESAAITRDDYTGIKIRVGSSWIKGRPFVCISGVWKPAKINVCSGITWKPGID